MFATTEAEKVLPTILSRCQRFDLRRIPSALIVQHLAGIAKQENVRIDEAALHAIARGADGGMRDAESTLDQLISFCGAEIAEADVLSMFGLAARSQILALGEALLAGEAEQGPAAVKRSGAARQRHRAPGVGIARTISAICSFFRCREATCGSSKLRKPEAAALRAQASRLHSDALTRMLEVLTDCEGRLRDTASKKILVEVTLLKMIEARDAMSIDTVLSRCSSCAPRPPPPPKTAAAPASLLPLPLKPAPLARPGAPRRQRRRKPISTNSGLNWSRQSGGPASSSTLT